jgi:hypothetical protein
MCVFGTEIIFFRSENTPIFLAKKLAMDEANEYLRPPTKFERIKTVVDANPQ